MWMLSACPSSRERTTPLCRGSWNCFVRTSWTTFWLSLVESFPTKMWTASSRQEWQECFNQAPRWMRLFASFVPASNRAACLPVNNHGLVRAVLELDVLHPHRSNPFVVCAFLVHW